VIQTLSSDNAPVPDDFISRFLQSAWQIIRSDVMRTLDVFGRLDMRSFHGLNGGLMVLLPKSVEATTIKDFRPISLIHCLGKLISKILANRLTPRLSGLVHRSQSSFIKGRYIQHNFRYVQAAVWLLHTQKKPCILFKVDLARAFN
jgi:hypothetical protein